MKKLWSLLFVIGSVTSGSATLLAADVKMLLSTTSSIYQTIKANGDSYSQDKINVINGKLNELNAIVSGAGEPFPLNATCDVRTTFIPNLGKYKAEFLVRFFYGQGVTSQWNAAVTSPDQYLPITVYWEGKPYVMEDYWLGDEPFVIKSGRNSSDEAAITSKYEWINTSLNCTVDLRRLRLRRWM